MANSEPLDGQRELRSVGYRRSKTTKRSVLLADRAADWTIRIGGMAVILAVLGIMVFLLQVVVPLFTGGRVVEHREFSKTAGAAATIIDRVDEYRSLSVAVGADGKVSAFHLGTGAALAAPSFDFGGKKLTAYGRTLKGDDLVFGFEDGTIRFGRLDIKAEILPGNATLPPLRPLGNRGDRTDGTALYSPLPGDQIRRQTIQTSLDAPQQIVQGRAIVATDYRVGGTVERPTRAVVTLDDAGVVRLSLAESRINIMTRQVRTQVNTTELTGLPAGLRDAKVVVTDKADQVYVGAPDGTIYRFDTRDFAKPALTETVDVLPGDTKLTVFAFLIGEAALMVGGSDGTVDIYFRLPAGPGARSTDGFQLVRAHQTEKHRAAVVALDSSQITKAFVTADANGEVYVRHMTSEQTLLRLKPKSGTADYEALVLSPRDDAVVGVGRDGKVNVWEIAIPHPETTWASIFGRVWYEGYDGPTFTWQSSSGTDSFEPKLSLVPLIFGTVKATIYAMLFAVPIALLGAIYTSEFLHPRVRATVKPVMEMMASLPSVVLGFIAALILAPLVETWIGAVLLAFVAVPLLLVLAAYVWQFMPTDLAQRYGGVPKFALIFVTMFLGIWLAIQLGGWFERAIFAGDLKAWANGDIGTETPFLTILLWPLGLVIVSQVLTRLAGDRIYEFIGSRTPRGAAVADALRWLVYALLAAVVSWIIASLMIAAGAGPRGGIVDTYVQRNTLVVGFAMAFAVIPIIYTISEDALNSVPEHLRAASLGCGATPWQTAVNVILPTAMSGVFAACMIGMGRAVGETMIVVMAAGNTPILEWNVFNGLRALSANIAVELPEAVRNGTLYRMLFLAALVLFLMTFVVNTLAEMIRLRFRRRAASL